MYLCWRSSIPSGYMSLSMQVRKATRRALSFYNVQRNELFGSSGRAYTPLLFAASAYSLAGKRLFFLESAETPASCCWSDCSALSEELHPKTSPTETRLSLPTVQGEGAFSLRYSGRCCPTPRSCTQGVPPWRGRHTWDAEPPTRQGLVSKAEAQLGCL